MRTALSKSANWRLEFRHVNQGHPRKTLGGFFMLAIISKGCGQRPCIWGRIKAARNFILIFAYFLSNSR